MRNLAALAALAGATALTACDVQQTREAKAPDVDVQAEGGQLPKYDVDTAEVEVGTTERTITTPEITTEKETVQVPVVGVEPPKE